MSFSPPFVFLKDYNFMQKLIDGGEYTNITEVVRDAVKRFRLEWRDMVAAHDLRPTGPMMGIRRWHRHRW